MSRSLALLAVLIGLLASTATTGHAAVRSCKAPLAGKLSNAASEQLARRNALQSWVALARQHGEGYASWRLAAQKTLKCVKGPSGGFDCIAYGSPCVIQQAPGRIKRSPGGVMSI